MNLSKSLSWKSVVAMALVAAAVPVFAQKHRAVRHPSPPGPALTVTATGTVVDDVTGLPVAFAEVRLGSRRDVANRQGQFRILSTTIYGAADVTATRSGYSQGKVTISTAGAHSGLTIRMAPTPTVTLRLTSGTQHQVDFESVEFGYVPPFGSYNKSSSEDFCKTDGSPLTLEKGQIARFTGPATLESFSPCCGTGPLLKVTAQLKTGETLPLYFTDSCQGYTVDFIGRDHVTGDFVFAKFTDVAEIVFP